MFENYNTYLCGKYLSIYLHSIIYYTILTFCDIFNLCIGY